MTSLFNIVFIFGLCKGSSFAKEEKKIFCSLTYVYIFIRTEKHGK